MSNELSIDNVVRVTLSGIPSGLKEPNVNNVALFTTEKPSNVDPYGEYLSAKSVGDDYGTSSVAYLMAVALFSQTPNILSGKGSLKIFPYIDAVSATQGNVKTVDLTSKLAAIILVSAGDLKVTLNSVVINLTGLDFTGCTTIADVAQVLQNALPNVIVEVTDSNKKIQLSSKKVGDDSDITIGQVSGGTGTDLSGANYFNTASSVETSGADSSGETLVEALARVDGLTDFVGVMTDLEMEDDVLLATANAIQAMDKIFVHHIVDTNDITTIGYAVQQATDTHTRIVIYSSSPEEANLMKSAYVGRAFSTNFSGVNTSTTLNLKALSTITPDVLSQTNYALCKTKAVDCYVSYAGVPSIASFGGNLYFDQIYSRIALKFALQVAGFNCLRQTNTKVPQTEQGLTVLKSAYMKVFERFVKNGYIGKGLVWNSSETFGDPEIFKQNITNNGYYVYSIPIAEQAQAERELRLSPLIQCSVKEAGAIHESDVIVVVEP